MKGQSVRSWPFIKKSEQNKEMKKLIQWVIFISIGVFIGFNIMYIITEVLPSLKDECTYHVAPYSLATFFKNYPPISLIIMYFIVMLIYWITEKINDETLIEKVFTLVLFITAIALILEGCIQYEYCGELNLIDFFK